MGIVPTADLYCKLLVIGWRPVPAATNLIGLYETPKKPLSSAVPPEKERPPQALHRAATTFGHPWATERSNPPKKPPWPTNKILRFSTYSSAKHDPGGEIPSQPLPPKLPASLPTPASNACDSRSRTAPRPFSPLSTYHVATLRKPSRSPSVMI